MTRMSEIIKEISNEETKAIVIDSKRSGYYFIVLSKNGIMQNHISKGFFSKKACLSELENYIK